jgi:phage terminase small subunit
MAQPAKQRKRDAVGNLCDLAEELGVAVEVRRSLGQKRRISVPKVP